MSYQDQLIDFASKYNENVGTISPGSRNYYLTSYHSSNLQAPEITDQYDHLSTFDNSTNQLNSNPFNEISNFNEANFSNSFSNQQINSQNNLDSGEFTYLYEDSTDSVAVYQTENTPLCFSNDSPLSSLSLEFLPPMNNLNGNNLLNNNDNNPKIHSQESQLNSTPDSLLNYNMESTPICFSYDSPISSLSLNLSCDGNISPFSLDFVNQRAQQHNKPQKDQDITSMISNMSIENATSTTSRSLTEESNKKTDLKFGNLSSDGLNSSFEKDNFSLLNLDTQQLNDATNVNQPPSPKFLSQSPNQSLVNSNHSINKFVSNIQQLTDNEQQSLNKINQKSDFNQQQSNINQQLNDRNSVDFEHDFDDEKSEKFYLEKCISMGRNKNTQFISSTANNQAKVDKSCLPIDQTSINKSSFSINHQNSSLNQENQQKEQILYYKSNLNPSSFKKLIKQHNSSPNQTNQLFNNQRPIQKPVTQKSPVKQIVKLDNDAETTITNFSGKYVPRTDYLIDGEEKNDQFFEQPKQILSDAYEGQRAENFSQEDCYNGDQFNDSNQLSYNLNKHSQFKPLDKHSPSQVKNKGGLKKLMCIFKKK